MLLEKIIQWLVNIVVVCLCMIVGGLLGLGLAWQGINYYMDMYPLDNITEVAQ